MAEKSSNADKESTESGFLNGPDLLQKALGELEDALLPFEINPDIDVTAFTSFLYLLWSDFHFYILEPFAGRGDDDSGDADGGAKIILLENGRKIIDYGFALSSSVGEDYGSYCQGRLYETIQEMANLLASRGVKKVSVVGSSIAMRVAWIACAEHEIHVANYEPNSADFSAQARIRALKEKAKKLKPGQELRL